MRNWYIAYHRWIDRPFVFRRTLDGEKIKDKMDREEWKVFMMECRYVDLPFPHYYLARDIDVIRYVESYDISLEVA